jgi:hypothetical protein
MGGGGRGLGSVMGAEGVTDDTTAGVLSDVQALF